MIFRICLCIFRDEDLDFKVVGHYGVLNHGIWTFESWDMDILENFKGEAARIVFDITILSLICA